MRIASLIIAAVVLMGCSGGKTDEKVAVTGSAVTTPGVDGTSKPVGGTIVVTGVSMPSDLRQEIQPGQEFRFELVPGTYLFSLEGATVSCAPVTVNVKSNQSPITITCRGM